MIRELETIILKNLFFDNDDIVVVLIDAQYTNPFSIKIYHPLVDFCVLVKSRGYFGYFQSPIYLNKW